MKRRRCNFPWWAGARKRHEWHHCHRDEGHWDRCECSCGVQL